jgi:hypothetical protein
MYKTCGLASKASPIAGAFPITTFTTPYIRKGKCIRNGRGNKGPLQ